MSEPITLYKLMILYMLQKVDFPLTRSQISAFILSHEYTTYFTFQSVLSELTEDQLVQAKSVRNNSYYTITDTGTETLSFFRSQISPRICEEIDQYLTDNKIKMRDEVSILADYYKTSEGEYAVHASVREKNSNLIELTLTLPNKKQAEIACSNWRAHCQKIYEDIIQELL